jgi:hypothetical protein
MRNSMRRSLRDCGIAHRQLALDGAAHRVDGAGAQTNNRCPCS